MLTDTGNALTRNIDDTVTNLLWLTDLIENFYDYFFLLLLKNRSVKWNTVSSV